MSETFKFGDRVTVADSNNIGNLWRGCNGVITKVLAPYDTLGLDEYLVSFEDMNIASFKGSDLTKWGIEG